MNPQHYTQEETRYLKDHIGLLPVREIAEHLGKDAVSVYRKAYSMALPSRHLGITKQEAEWILELALDGMPVTLIAKKFDLPTYSLNLFIEFRRRETAWP